MFQGLIEEEEEWIIWLFKKMLFIDLGSCSIFRLVGVEPYILLEINVLLDAPLVKSIALDNEFDIVFPENLLFEEPEFTLIPLPLLEMLLLYIWFLWDCETNTPDGSL